MSAASPDDDAFRIRAGATARQAVARSRRWFRNRGQGGTITLHAGDCDTGKGLDCDCWPRKFVVRAR